MSEKKEKISVKKQNKLTYSNKLEDDDIKQIEKVIGYTFKNKTLLKHAFMHCSCGFPNYQRLEYLGDSILNLAITEKQYSSKIESEGNMSKERAALICEQTLSSVIIKVGLEKYMLLGESFKGLPTISMCADLFESIIGAIYEDSNRNFELCRNFIFEHIDINSNNIIDYKTRLQEIVQRKKGFSIEYQTKQTNPNKIPPNFKSTLIINGEFMSTATGGSKKEAERNCAKIAYENLLKDKNK